MVSSRMAPLCPSDAPLVGYTFVRHIGLILDELSSQGLELWVDERGRWQWRWQATELQAERGFWALGEALLDAVVTRYPTIFATGTDNADK